MSWSKGIATFALSIASWHCAHAVTDEVCPERIKDPLRYVDVFDGEPAELATLEPDLAKENHGNWLLGYIYDEGRFVTVRCKYSRREILDVKITKRINRCDYKIDSKKVLKIDCR